jgi:hypothetical protein
MVWAQQCASHHNFRVRAGFQGHAANDGSELSVRSLGVETLPDHQAQRPRHRHGAGYATVVLAGDFIESGFAGRIVARAGDGFRCTFGISPKRFRLKVRPRRTRGAMVTSYRAL